MSFMAPGPEVVNTTDQVSDQHFRTWRRSCLWPPHSCTQGVSDSISMLEHWINHQVPEAFDSIAATFGFEHHVGTDATLELKVDMLR